MNKFRVNKPFLPLEPDEEIEVQRFSKGAKSHEVVKTLDKNEKPNKSFTIPFNEYELDLLRRAAKKDNRSQRYIARLLLIEAMKKYILDFSSGGEGGELE